MKFSGVGVSPGIVVGKAYVLAGGGFCVAKTKIKAPGVDDEIARLKSAITKTADEIRALQKRLADEIGDEHARLLEAHVLVLEDEALIERVTEKVKKDRVNAGYALSVTLESFAETLSRSSDSYLRSRAEDIKDVGRRVLENLIGLKQRSLSDIEEPVIVVAFDLSPADTASMHGEKVIGFATDIGSRTSHTAIMARSLEIPAVVGLKEVTKYVSEGDTLIIDGIAGTVIVNPDAETSRKYREKRRKFEVMDRELMELSKLPAQTIDGRVVKLMANIELAEELSLVVSHGSEGIGLYRTEFFYLHGTDLPNEDEQCEAYSHVARSVAPHSVVIRTVDLGGDKFISRLQMPEEVNPFMGLRGIRFCLEQPELFQTQLRAILRASTEGRIAVMFPLVSSLEEVYNAKSCLEKAKESLRAEKKDFDENLEVGVMVETPAAAMIADILANEVDFFSIGTNDLIQYAIAIDRVNERVASLYRPSHPGVLRLIKRVVDAGHRKGIRVEMCGEMAGESRFTACLLGMGLDGLSMSPGTIPEIKKLVRNTTLSKAQDLAREVLKLSTADDVERVLGRRGMRNE